ncbi:MAG TPA: RdgB/HAM1 family non-canonical purine NTP pyrophosphatase [Candidatus Acidoferrum sp.]
MSQAAAGQKSLYLASGNPGKLREYRELARSVGCDWELELLKEYSALAEFEETAPTFAENAAGKALYYAQATDDLVFADDSGLVVPALNGAPGVLSARYAGPGASNEQRIAKLLQEMSGLEGSKRSAHFVCVIAAARKDCVLAVVSGKVDGEIVKEPKGSGGFGYDPLFFFPDLGGTFAELSSETKNTHSHRGKAFRRLIEVLR